MLCTFPTHRVSFRQESTATENSNSLLFSQLHFNNVTFDALYHGGHLVMCNKRCEVQNQGITLTNIDHLTTHQPYLSISQSCKGDTPFIWPAPPLATHLKQNTHYNNYIIMPMFPLWSHNTWLPLTRPDGLPAATVEKYTQLFTTGDQLLVTSNQEYMLWFNFILGSNFLFFCFWVYGNVW